MWNFLRRTEYFFAQLLNLFKLFSRHTGEIGSLSKLSQDITFQTWNSTNFSSQTFSRRVETGNTFELSHQTEIYCRTLKICTRNNHCRRTQKFPRSTFSPQTFSKNRIFYYFNFSNFLARIWKYLKTLVVNFSRGEQIVYSPSFQAFPRTENQTHNCRKYSLINEVAIYKLSRRAEVFLNPTSKVKLRRGAEYFFIQLPKVFHRTKLASESFSRRRRGKCLEKVKVKLETYKLLQTWNCTNFSCRTLLNVLSANLSHSQTFHRRKLVPLTTQKVLERNGSCSL